MELYSFDDAYVARLRARDRFTEEHFLRYFSELMLIKLRRQLRTFQAIDDVRQEVFLRVLQTIRSENSVRDGRRLGSFVNSVCNNVVLEMYRRIAARKPSVRSTKTFRTRRKASRIFW